MKCSPFFFLFLFSFPLFAQLGSNPNDNEQNLRALANLSPMSAGARTFDNRYEGVKGSPLLLPEIAPLDIRPADRDNVVTGLNGNLDLEKNLLLVRFKDGAYGSIPASSIHSVAVTTTAGKKTFRALSAEMVEGQKNEGTRFYEQLYEGGFHFLKMTRKVLQKANYKGAYSPDRRYDEYLDEIIYFLRSGSGPYEKIRLKGKSLEKALPDRANDIKSITKKNQLDLGTESGVIALLRKLEGE